MVSGFSSDWLLVDVGQFDDLKVEHTVVVFFFLEACVLPPSHVGRPASLEVQQVQQVTRTPCAR